MAMDFPASPTVGQSFAPGNGNQYVWDGVAWTAFNQASPAFIADTPPVNPAVGQMWWRGTNGKFYMWVDDGNSKQWVEIGNAGATPGLWETLASTDVAGVTQFVLTDLGAFETLALEMDLQPDTANAGYAIQVSTDNGATWVSGASDYAFYYVIGGSTANASAAQVNASSFQLTLGQSIGVGSNSSGFTCSLKLSSFNKTTRRPRLRGNIQYQRTGDAAVFAGAVGGCVLNQTLQRNAVKVLSSNAFSGRIYIQGARG